MGRQDKKDRKCPICKHPDIKFIWRLDTWLRQFECQSCKEVYWWGY